MQAKASIRIMWARCSTMRKPPGRRWRNSCIIRSTGQRSAEWSTLGANVNDGRQHPQQDAGMVAGQREAAADQEEIAAAIVGGDPPVRAGEKIVLHRPSAGRDRWQAGKAGRAAAGNSRRRPAAPRRGRPRQTASIGRTPRRRILSPPAGRETGSPSRHRLPARPRGSCAALAATARLTVDPRAFPDDCEDISDFTAWIV